MYQTNILFNFFKKVDRTNLSSQEVYHLFKLYNTFNPGVGYRQFCVYVTLYLANFQSLQKSFLVLNLLFCSKIVSLLKVTSVFNSYQTQQSCNLLFTFHSNPSAVYDNLTIF